MSLIKRITNSLVMGLLFFLLEIVIAIVFGYLVIKIHGLEYNFKTVFHEGVRFGLYLGVVIAVLAFISPPRRGPPF
jgi:hypothetical protein